MLQEALTEAATDRKEFVDAWLDLTNAFTSVPHMSIHRSLEAHGLPDKTRSIIKSMYRDATTRIREIERSGEGCFVGGIKKSNLIYADDMALLVDSVGEMERLLTTAEEAASLVGLVFNPSNVQLFIRRVGVKA